MFPCCRVWIQESSPFFWFAPHCYPYHGQFESKCFGCNYFSFPYFTIKIHSLAMRRLELPLYFQLGMYSNRLSLRWRLLSSTSLCQESLIAACCSITPGSYFTPAETGWDGRCKSLSCPSFRSHFASSESCFLCLRRKCKFVSSISPKSAILHLKKSVLLLKRRLHH